MARSASTGTGVRDVSGEVEALRRKLASMSDGAAAQTAVLPVPEAMAPLFPRVESE